jgi:membrane-associated phospholipid phosphatase
VREWFLTYEARWITAAALVLLILLFIPVRIFNHAIFHSLNGLHSPASDVVWLGLTTLGDGLVLAIILGAFLVRDPRVAALGLLLLLASSVAVQVMKAMFPSARPVAVLQGVHVVGPLLRSGSFPSGHACSTMCACLAVSHFCRSWATSAAVVFLGALVGCSRIFVGAHFPVDVLGGIILAGLLFAVSIRLVWPRLGRRLPDRPTFSRGFFRSAFWVEVMLAAFVASVWAWHAAELPPVAAAVGNVVLLTLWIGYRSRRVPRSS